jgi:predicted NBD/HSP70 family sugar kinase
LPKKNSAVTLSLDIGGTGLKAMLLDEKGTPMTDRVRVETPRPCPPKVLLKNFKTLVSSLAPYDRISAGFEVVRKGVVTAPTSAPTIGMAADGPASSPIGASRLT